MRGRNTGHGNRALARLLFQGWFRKLRSGRKDVNELPFDYTFPEDPCREGKRKIEKSYTCER